mgnify:CR=1 FL=1
MYQDGETSLQEDCVEFNSPTVHMKKCTKCLTIKPFDEFHKDSNKKDGIRYWCKDCTFKYQKDRAEKNPQHVKSLQRNNDLKRHYKISLNDYNKMFLDQGGVCAICGKYQKHKNLAVDHCHKTGKVRQLLCQRCNRVLGVLKEDVLLINSILSYIKLHNT